MPLAFNTRLGRYEIRSLLGEGGMGEVYLAEDTTLRRLVAVKLLPLEFTADQDRSRRFEREASSQIAARQTGQAAGSSTHTTSSAEYIVEGVMRHKRGAGAGGARRDNRGGRLSLLRAERQGVNQFGSGHAVRQRRQ